MLQYCMSHFSSPRASFIHCALKLDRGFVSVTEEWEIKKQNPYQARGCSEKKFSVIPKQAFKPTATSK